MNKIHTTAPIIGFIRYSQKIFFGDDIKDMFEPHYFEYRFSIGENVSFNSDVHIGCIDKIQIGNNCLFASRVFISDHDHGNTSLEDMVLHPHKRPLRSKGPIIIEDNCWIGEGVAILSGVTIGKNSIIATNSVVTKDIPEFCIAAGIPARIIKSINNE